MNISRLSTYTEVDSKLSEAEVHYTLPSLPEWIETRVIYPFGMAVARITFTDKRNPNNGVSTYLDAFDQLGSMGQPYFELYPAVDGGTERFLVSEEPQLYERVIASLESRRR